MYTTDERRTIEPCLRETDDCDAPESSGGSRYRTSGQSINKVSHAKAHTREARDASGQQEKTRLDQVQVLEQKNAKPRAVISYLKEGCEFTLDSGDCSIWA